MSKKRVSTDRLKDKLDYIKMLLLNWKKEPHSKMRTRICSSLRKDILAIKKIIKKG